MRFEAVYPLYLLHFCPPEELPWVAVNELLAGRGGDAVAQLAGMDRPTSRDVEEILDSALQELGIERLTPREAWTRRVGGYLDDIVAGSVDPGVGAFRLWELQVQNPDRELDLDDRAVHLLYWITWGLGAMVDDEELPPEDRAEAAKGIVGAAQDLRALL
jgi:hypothetical protein